VPSLPPEPHSTGPDADILPPLATARSLLPPDYDEDDGDFEPGLYKGFAILPPSEWPDEAHRFPTSELAGHANQRSRFYVRHNDTVGLVPWPGSKVIWPWDEAWMQPDYRSDVTPLLKQEEEKKGGKK
jgi:hypothetical protein